MGIMLGDKRTTGDNLRRQDAGGGSARLSVTQSRWHFFAGA
jgi:hypothetical protein